MKTILLQLDTDSLASTFDRVVAADAGVDEVFSYGGVSVENVESLVHGMMFTRGPGDLKHSAIFVGGSGVPSGEALLQKVREILFPPLTVSVMMDANGSNTTAAAAVLAAKRHVSLSGTSSLVLGGTGPVGLRVAELLAREGAAVQLGSRTDARAEDACRQISERVPNANCTPCVTTEGDALKTALAEAEVIIAAGAPRVQFLTGDDLESAAQLKVAIDLNAVPPLGLGGVEVTDKAKEKFGCTVYGAIGVGGTKMKIHRAALQQLFESNDQVLDTELIYEIGKGLEG